jgi:hypothetical protein
MNARVLVMTGAGRRATESSIRENEMLQKMRNWASKSLAQGNSAAAGKTWHKRDFVRRPGKAKKFSAKNQSEAGTIRKTCAGMRLHRAGKWFHTSVRVAPDALCESTRAKTKWEIDEALAERKTPRRRNQDHEDTLEREHHQQWKPDLSARSRLTWQKNQRTRAAKWNNVQIW